MKIIKPYARMIRLTDAFYDDPPEVPKAHGLSDFKKEMGIGLLKHIEWCARISHRSEEAITPTSWEKIIEHVVMKHGDWSVVEHATVSVDMVVDRGITHEWVRHRLNAFTQESTRFVNYIKNIPPSFIYPIVGVECSLCLGGDIPEEKYCIPPGKDSGNYLIHHVGNTDMRQEIGTLCQYELDWYRAVDYAELQYKQLVSKKWRPQEARSVFPNALSSRIITTSNLRNWRHMFIMRTSAEAHPQMRQVMIPLLDEFKEKIPLLFDDIVANGKQSEMMSRPR